MFKFSAELWKCVTRNNLCWQTVPQPSTSPAVAKAQSPSVAHCDSRTSTVIFVEIPVKFSLVLIEYILTIGCHMK